MNYHPPAHVADTVTATLTADQQSAQRIGERLAEAFFADDVAVSIVDTGDGQWRVMAYFRGEVDQAAVRKVAGADAGKALRFERVAAKDWVAESLLGLKPIAAGRFVIHGAHDRDRARGRIAIEIEAAQAFGTGHHGSTRGCLLALDAMSRELGRRPKVRAKRTSKQASKHGGRAPRILDLGTGSGVLAIAAAKSLRRRVLASDIDAQAVRIARENARLNRSAALVQVCRAGGIAAAEIRAGAPFALVFANILLAPLQRLAAPVSALLAPRGRLILSGLLNAQANAARAAYPHFKLERRIAVDGWTTLVLRRSSTLPATPRRRHLPIHCR